MRNPTGKDWIGTNGFVHGAGLIKSGHECVVYDACAATVQELAAKGAIPATSLPDLVKTAATARFRATARRHVPPGVRSKQK